MGRTTGKTEKCNWGCQIDIRPTHARQAAKQPEHHASCLICICRSRDDVGRQSIKKLRSGNTSQNYTVTATTCTCGQQRHQKKCDHCSDKRACRQGQNTITNTENHDAHGTCGGSCRNAQHKWFCQWIPEQSLQYDATKCQGSSCTCSHQRSAQTIVPNHPFMYTADFKRHSKSTLH